jgi:hypothetical protein
MHLLSVHFTLQCTNAVLHAVYLQQCGSCQSQQHMYVHIALEYHFSTCPIIMMYDSSTKHVKPAPALC